MGLETGTYISDLNSSNPVAGDPVNEGDDHIRLVKSTVKATFPSITGAVTSTHTELNKLDGVTANTATTLQAVYPVGSIYINAAVATNPGTLLGFGTWAAFGAGRVIVGLNAADSDFDTVQETGGAKTHTLSVAELPSHTHGFTLDSSENGGSSKDHSLILDGSSSSESFTTASTGSGSAHNNVQPYIVAYMWRRTG